jgi:hypothetical protein
MTGQQHAGTSQASTRPLWAGFWVTAAAALGTVAHLRAPRPPRVSPRVSRRTPPTPPGAFVCDAPRATERPCSAHWVNIEAPGCFRWRINAPWLCLQDAEDGVEQVG